MKIKRLNRTPMGKKALLLLPFAAALMVLTALTAKPPTKEEGKAACQSDVLAHCKVHVITGQKEKVQSCLKEHRDELSDPCRSFIDRSEAFQNQMKAQCGSDIAQYCAPFRGNQKAMKACIAKNIKQFKPGCKEFLKSMREG